MSRVVPVVAAVASIVALATIQLTAGAAVAAPGTGAGFASPPPEDLQVSGGEERWHPDNGFRLEWKIPEKTGIPPIVAIHLRVLDPAGAVAVPDTRFAWLATMADRIQLPDAPGTYTAEVWLENELGSQGLPARAKLNFDNQPPGAVSPLAAPDWIGRAALPYLMRLGHPAQPLPRSGIRGYAVSVDPTADRSPCAAADRCTDAETDLRAGIAGDSLPLAMLPEGTSYLHAVAVSGAGLRSTVVGQRVVHVDTTDPVTVLEGVPVGWTDKPVSLTAAAADALSGMQPAGGGGPFTAIRIDGSAPIVAPGARVDATVIGEGAHTIVFYGRDAAGNVNDGSGTNPAPATAMVRIDREPPSVAFVSAQSPDDPELIEARVADSLSGTDASRGRVSVRRMGAKGPFEPLPTEFSGGRLRARWDSDAYPAGEYEFRATGYDTAGNAVTTGQRANGSPMLLPNPLKTQTALQTGFGGKVLAWHRCVRRDERRHCRREVIEGYERRPQARFVPYGKGMLFSGHLVAASGSPLAQMPVQVSERFAPGAGQSDRVTTVKTDADGIFLARLAPGPSRLVSATFAGTRTLARSSDEPVRLGVRGGVRMRPSAAVATIGGRPIVFHGRVEAGAAIPAEGKSVQLQFRLPGLPWTEFRTIQTDAGGHFRYPYRFSDDDSRGVRFQFRAFAPAQGNWPYEPAASRPVAVTGR